MTDVTDTKSLSYTQLLQTNRPYRNLWSAQVVSNAGDWFNSIAVFALTLELTGSGLALSVVMIAQMLPNFLMAPVAGVVADRFDKKKIMIITDIFRGIVAFGFLLIDGPEDVWLIFLFMGLLSGSGPFFDATRNATLPSIVQGKNLLVANALSSATWGLMLTLGSAIGGGIAAIFGRDVSFILNGSSFLISALFVLRVTIPKSVKAKEAAHFFSDFIKGLGYIKRDPSTRIFLPVKAVWGIGAGTAMMLYALFGAQVFSRGDAGIAILYTARGLGTLIGTFGMKFFSSPTLPKLRYSIFLGLTSYGIFFIIFSYSPSLWIAAIALTLATSGSMVMWVFSSLGLQLVVREDFRGRAFAAEGGLFTLASTISTLSGGLFLSIFDARSTAFAAGLIGVIAAIIWFLMSKSTSLGNKVPPPAQKV